MGVSAEDEAVTLAGGIKVEISATERCAIYRISYPKGARSRLLVDPRWCITRSNPASACIRFADVARDGMTGASGKVVVNNRRYGAETTYFSDTDIATARRDASGRAVEDLARQIVDDVTSCRWDDTKAKEAVK